MALGRKPQNGLDLSRVGKKSMSLPGGNRKGRPGLEIATRDGKRSSGSASRATMGSSSHRRGANYVNNSGMGHGQQGQKKTLMIAVAILVGAILISVAVGAFVYQQVLRNSLKTDISSETYASVLTTPENSSDSSWGIMVRTDAPSAEVGRGQVKDLALLYVDPDNKAMSVFWIPVDTRVYVDGYGYRTVGEAFELQGETGVTAAVAKLGDIEVAHYLEFNDAGLSRFESDLSPISVDADTADHSALMMAVCKRVFGSSSEQLTSVADSFVACATTDMDAKMAVTVLSQLQGMDTEKNLYQVDAPTKEVSEEEISYLTVDTDSWNSMLARVVNGMAPVADKEELEEYESMRKGSSIEIWNGVGTPGVAAGCEKELKKLGWHVSYTGNASQFVYPETLVVYNSADKKPLAELLVSDLGQGRVVLGTAHYNFSADVLVVIGSNYKPY